MRLRFVSLLLMVTLIMFSIISVVPVSALTPSMLGWDIATARNWCYQLQNADPLEIANSPFEVVVIDYSRDGSEMGEYSREEIMLIRESGKLPLAYLCIGQAEDYRFYWKDEWYENPPSWLGKEDPEHPGNYYVKYWDPEWKQMIFEYIDRIMSQGFMGVYLDRIDAFEYWSNPDNGEDLWLPEEEAARRMIELVLEIANYCRYEKGVIDFCIVPQNGENILEYDDGRYLKTISGIAVEDLFYIEVDPAPENWISERVKYLDIVKNAGKPVFVVDYVDDGSGYTGENKERIGDFISKALERGYIPYPALSDRELDELNVIEELFHGKLEVKVSKERCTVGEEIIIQAVIRELYCSCNVHTWMITIVKCTENGGEVIGSTLEIPYSRGSWCFHNFTLYWFPDEPGFYIIEIALKEHNLKACKCIDVRAVPEADVKLLNLTYPREVYIGNVFTVNATLELNLGYGTYTFKIGIWDTDENRSLTYAYMRVEGPFKGVKTCSLELLSPSHVTVMHLKLAIDMEYPETPSIHVESNFTVNVVKPPSTVTVEGYVLDAETGEPLQNASIIVGNLTAYTDERGYFKLTVPIGQVTIMCTANGYLPQKLTIDTTVDRLYLTIYMCKAPSKEKSELTWIQLLFALFMALLLATLIAFLMCRR